MTPTATALHHPHLIAGPAPGPAPAPALPPPPRRLGEMLLASGAVAPGDLVEALSALRRENARLGDVLIAREMVAQDALDAALARQAGIGRVGRDHPPPDSTLARQVAPETCLRLGFVPLHRDAHGNAVIATANPERPDAVRASLPDGFAPVRFVYANTGWVHAAVAEAHRDTLLRRAETRCPAFESCRTQHRARAGKRVLAIAAAVLATVIAAPTLVLSALLLVCVLALLANTGLRLVGAFTALRARWRLRPGRGFRSRRSTLSIARLPCVSILVPLYREADVLPRLIVRLERLDYPRELLDICLVIEERDRATHDALETVSLPPWMRVIAVPDAALKTKPRAMNYALDFCRGTIVGVYDAEDAPDPGQIRQVVDRFHRRGPELACVQGVLDYYNSRANWLARCFTVEYAAWFRLILPGIEALRLPIPLGGTTLFIRRDVLEELGGWDAHNVTEDADLGMRLARHGYRCEFIPTVTHEEAACSPWRWVRQRSRWLKGFAITWASHMRRPRELLDDLGLAGFLTFQVLFLGTVAGFAAAPLLWSFWVWTLTGSAPLAALLPDWAMLALGGLFVVSEVTVISVGMIATSGREHRHLWPWVPTLHFYFPLATLGAYKALYELVMRPFYWDKTDHGQSQPAAMAARAEPAAQDERAARG